LETQTPACELPPIEPPRREAAPAAAPSLFPPMPPEPANDEENGKPAGAPADDENDSDERAATNTAYETKMADEELPPQGSSANSALRVLQSESADVADTNGVTVADGMMPLGWPHEGSFIPPAPSAARPACIPTDSPVMTHTRIYHGHDGDFTQALATYYHFRNDARFGGWQNYLQRSDDFMRFCCHMHISEMLSARGGADQTRVVWRWPDSR
jgi:hypothetical protein